MKEIVFRGWGLAEGFRGHFAVPRWGPKVVRMLLCLRLEGKVWVLRGSLGEAMGMWLSAAPSRWGIRVKLVPRIFRRAPRRPGCVTWCW